MCDNTNNFRKIQFKLIVGGGQMSRRYAARNRPLNKQS